MDSHFVVCAVIICASLFLFRRFPASSRQGRVTICSCLTIHSPLSHFIFSQALVRMNKKSLFQALEKLKGVLRFAALQVDADGVHLAAVGGFSGGIQKICISESYTATCGLQKRRLVKRPPTEMKRRPTSDHASAGLLLPADGLADVGSDHLSLPGKVPLLSIEAIHELHIFIFALATIHVLVSVKNHSSRKDVCYAHTLNHADSDSSAYHHETKFIGDHFHGTGKDSLILSWVLTYGYSSCIMDETKYAIPKAHNKLQDPLPQYALVSQMGSSLKPAVFEEHIKEGLIHWAQKAKTKGKTKMAKQSRGHQLQSDVSRQDFLMEEGQTEIVQSNGTQICRKARGQ
ncbi:hypothetical protein HPP92_023736 [Vanilla planifolia]|uniref:Uncharacterized protein n=1 Tax=Vanilla planifolia TaxID=51239 RepID=A0A835PVX8_VANPL|nr:hypothetical protein HPP92_023736 [Vanilla planifolia]